MCTELFGLCVILLVCSSLASDVDRCPSFIPRDTYLHTHGDRCYRFVTFQKRTWNAAQAECYHAHGRLADIPDQATNDFIHSTLKQMHYHETGAWIGFNDKHDEGKWLWDSGRPATFQNWAAHQPGFGHSFEDCALLNMHDGKWHDYSCSLFIDHFGYICMYGMLPSSAATTITTKRQTTATTMSATMTTVMASHTMQPTTATTKIPHTSAPSTMQHTAAPTATTKVPHTLAPSTMQPTAAPTANTKVTHTAAPSTMQPTAAPTATTKVPHTSAPSTMQPTAAPTANTKVPHTSAPSTMQPTAAPTATKVPHTTAPSTMQPTAAPTANTKVPHTLAPSTKRPTVPATTSSTTPMKTDAPTTTSKPGCVPLDGCDLVCDKTGYVKDDQGCDICLCIS